MLIEQLDEFQFMHGIQTYADGTPSTGSSFYERISHDERAWPAFLEADLSTTYKKSSLVQSEKLKPYMMFLVEVQWVVIHPDKLDEITSRIRFMGMNTLGMTQRENKYLFMRVGDLMLLFGMNPRGKLPWSR